MIGAASLHKVRLVRAAASSTRGKQIGTWRIHDRAGKVVKVTRF